MVGIADSLNTDVLLRTVSYLPYETIQQVRRVNKFWNSTVRKRSILVSKNVKENELSRFNSLQVAVDKCEDYSKIIFLSTTLLSTGIRNKHLILSGEGGEVTINDPGFMFHIENSSVIIKDISIRCLCELECVFQASSSSVYFINCTFIGNDNLGTWININGGRGTFERCTFSNANYAIVSTAPTSVNACHFSDMRSNSIDVEVSTYISNKPACTIMDTTIKGGFLGIAFTSENNSVLIQNTQVSHSRIGIVLRGTFSIEHCSVSHSRQIGIWIDRAEEGIFGTISHCEIIRCDEGLRSRATDFSFRNSKVSYCKFGFHVWEGTAVTLRNNIISNCRLAGFWVRNVKILRILRNAVYDCKAGARIQRSKSVQIEGNWFLYFRKSVFSFEGLTSRVEILDNTFCLSQDYSKVNDNDSFLPDSAVVTDNRIISPFGITTDAIFSPENNYYIVDSITVSPIVREKGIDCEELDKLHKNKSVTPWTIAISLSLIFTTTLLLLKNIKY